MISTLNPETYKFWRWNGEVYTGKADVMPTLRAGHKSQSNVKSLIKHNRIKLALVSDPD